MSEKTEEKQEKEERQRARPGLIWPVILITAGALWLLSTTGTIEVDWWRLVRLWPVLLIIWGIEVLLAGRSLLANLLVVILALAVAGGAAFYVVSDVPFQRGEGMGVDRFSEPLNGVRQAQLDLNMPAGTLVLESLGDRGDLVRGVLNLAGREQPNWMYRETDGRAEMALAYERDNWFRALVPGESETWTVRVSPEAELSLTAELGAGQLELDLADLDVRDLEAQTAVGQSLLTVPDQGRLEGTVRNVIGQLVVDIPRNMGAQIRIDRALTTVSMPARFREVEDGLYQTEGWESSEERVDLTLGVVIGQVTVRDAGR
jgi:hypothetical protein